MSSEETKRKQEILEALRRRKHERELQASKLGLSADPSIKIEIEDIGRAIQNIEQETMRSEELNKGINTEQKVLEDNIAVLSGDDHSVDSNKEIIDGFTDKISNSPTDRVAIIVHRNTNVFQVNVNTIKLRRIIDNNKSDDYEAMWIGSAYVVFGGVKRLDVTMILDDIVYAKAILLNDDEVSGASFYAKKDHVIASSEYAQVSIKSSDLRRILISDVNNLQRILDIERKRAYLDKYKDDLRGYEKWQRDSKSSESGIWTRSYYTDYSIQISETKRKIEEFERLVVQLEREMQ